MLMVNQGAGRPPSEGPRTPSGRRRELGDPRAPTLSHSGSPPPFRPAVLGTRAQELGEALGSTWMVTHNSTSPNLADLDEAVFEAAALLARNRAMLLVARIRRHRRLLMWYG
jgi:hypothetical protein